MCTLTVWRDATRLIVTMNRDDAAARPEAPPRLWVDRDASFAAPVDLEAGGAWIGLNSHGVIACLLNRYDVTRKGERSRGSVVVAAMAGADATRAAACVEGLDHRLYAPFTCLIVAQTECQRIDWNGERCERAPVRAMTSWMITSSSWRIDEVRARREALFAAHMANGGAEAALSAFHCQHHPDEEAWAPMMRREASQTKSITQVRIDGAGAEMRYWRRERAVAKGLVAPDQTLSLPQLAEIAGR